MERKVHNEKLRAAQNLQFLTKEQMEDIHAQACRLLQEVGCIVNHKGALEMLEKAGCRVVKKRVYMPPALVEWATRQAPSHVYIYDRDGDYAMDLGGRNAYFGTGSDCCNYYDSFKDEQRPFTTEDMYNCAKAIDALPEMDFLMCCGLMYDYPVTSYEHQFEAMIRNSTKPMVATAADQRCMETMRDMALVFRNNDLEELRSKPYFIMYNEPTSPLNHTKTAVEKLIFCAENGIPTNYASGAMSGATAPITVAGSLIETVAESLSGLVIHQLVRPGAPFVWGGVATSMDLKGLQVTYCSPETQIHHVATTEIGRELYKLPTWGHNGNTGAKIPDAQAMNEAVQTIWQMGIAGVNLNHDIGFMNYGLTYSIDLLVMCNETIAQLRRFMDGVVMDEEHCAYDLIKKVGPKGHFLSEKHTLKFEKEEQWHPDLTDRVSFEDWEAKGRLSYNDRVKLRVKDIIENYQPKALTAEQDAQITKILADRDAEAAR